jgi:hypothetical protein
MAQEYLIVEIGGHAHKCYLNVRVVQHPSTFYTQFQDIYYKAVGAASLLCLHVQGYGIPL